MSIQEKTSDESGAGDPVRLMQVDAGGSDPENTDSLAAVNQKIIADGEVLPAVRLKDGSKVQTGTVATMLHNVKLYNEGARGEVEKELELAVPTLINVGLFELFSVEEWLSGENAGRTFVGERAREYLKKQTDR